MGEHNRAGLPLADKPSRFPAPERGYPREVEVCRYRRCSTVFRRRQVKTHGRLMREELGEGVAHLRMAAAHAAEGAAGALAPRVIAARAAVEPGLRKTRGIASDGTDSLLAIARGRARASDRRVRRG